MHLNAWKDAYGINIYPKGAGKLSFPQRMYLGGRAGLKYNVRFFNCFFLSLCPMSSTPTSLSSSSRS